MSNQSVAPLLVAALLVALLVLLGIYESYPMARLLTVSSFEMGLLALAIGLLVTLLLGFTVGPLIKRSTKRIAELAELPPEGVTKEKWTAATGMPDEKPGEWLGWFERVLSFVAFGLEQFVIIVGWLAFKVASKWQVWHSVIRVPDSLLNVPPLSYLEATRAVGSWMMMRFLVGTISNVLAGFIGVFIARNLPLLV